MPVDPPWTAEVMQAADEQWEADQHPLLHELAHEEIRAAKAHARCERHHIPVAVFTADGWLITNRRRHHRGDDERDVVVLAHCRRCPETVIQHSGEKVHLATREVDLRRAWRLADQRAHRGGRLGFNEIVRAVEVVGPNFTS